MKLEIFRRHMERGNSVSTKNKFRNICYVMSYILISFLLTRNCRFSFLEGTVERIYVVASISVSVLLCLFFFAVRHFSISWRKDKVIYLLALYFCGLFVRNLSGGRETLHVLISTYYPVIATGCFIAVASERHPRELALAYTIYGLGAMTLNFVEGILLRDLSDIYSTSFFFMGARNQFSIFAATTTAMLCTYCEMSGQKNWWLRPLTAVVLAANAMMMQSATTKICTVPLCIILLLPASVGRYSSNGLSAVLISGYGLGWCSLVLWRIQNYFAGFILRVFNRGVTFTHRTDIWDAALNQIKEHLIVGHGILTDANAFEITVTYSNGATITRKLSAHNQILQSLFEGGFYAVVSYIIIFFVSFKDRRDSGYFLACLAVVLVNFLSEAPGMYSFFFLCFLAFYSPNWKNDSHCSGEIQIAS